jgi:hypothetical protein
MAITANEVKKEIRATYNEEQHVIGKTNIIKYFPYVTLLVVREVSSSTLTGIKELVSHTN